MADAAGPVAQADKILTPSEIMYLLSLVPKKENNSKATPEDTSEASPNDFWEKKYNFYQSLYEMLAGNAETQGFLDMPMGLPESNDRESLHNQAEEIIEHYESRSEPTEADMLELITSLRTYCSLPVGSLEYTEAASHLKAIKVALGQLRNLFTALDEERKALFITGNTHLLSKYRCVLTGNVINEPVKLTDDSEIYYEESQLRQWARKCKAKLSEILGQEVYQAAGIDRYMLDPATAAPQLLVYTKPTEHPDAEEIPQFVIDQAHALDVDRYKKALCIQRTAYEAARDSDHQTFMLLMSCIIRNPVESDESPSASGESDIGADSTASEADEGKNKTLAIDRAWAIHMGDFDDTKYEGLTYTAHMGKGSGSKPTPASMVIMTEVAAKLKETLMTKKASMDHQQADTTDQANEDVQESPLENKDPIDYDVMEMSELDFVIKHGHPDASLDLFVLPLAKIFSSKLDPTTSSLYKNAQKILKIIHEQISSPETKQHASRLMYTLERQFRKSLLLKGDDEFKSPGLPERATINVLLEHVTQLYESKISRLASWKSRGGGTKAFYCITFGRKGDLARARRTKKVVIKNDASSWKDRVIGMLSSEVMKATVKGDGTTPLVMRGLLERLDFALGVAPVAGEHSPIPEQPKKKKSMTDKDKALERLKYLPKKMESYFTHPHTEHYEISQRDGLKGALARLEVTAEMLAKQSDKLGFVNITSNYMTQDKLENKLKKQAEAQQRALNEQSRRSQEAGTNALANQSELQRRELDERAQRLVESERLAAEREALLRQEQQASADKEATLRREKEEALADKEATLRREKEEALADKDAQIAQLLAEMEAMKSAQPGNQDDSAQAGASGGTGATDNRGNRYWLMRKKTANQRNEGLISEDVDPDAPAIDLSVSGAV